MLRKKAQRHRTTEVMKQALVSGLDFRTSRHQQRLRHGYFYDYNGKIAETSDSLKLPSFNLYIHKILRTETLNWNTTWLLYKHNI